jgi:hypothetical protein
MTPPEVLVPVRCGTHLPLSLAVTRRKRSTFIAFEIAMKLIANQVP